MHTSRRVLWTLPALAAALVAAAPAHAAPDSRATAAAVRPTPSVVKRGLIKKYVTDEQYGPYKLKLSFKSLKLLKTRRSVPNRDFIEPGKWVTPVAAVFTQTSRNTGDGQCLVYRWNWTGIFWKGDFGWTFKNRDVTFKRIADTC